MQIRTPLNASLLGLVLALALLLSGSAHATSFNPELWEFTGSVQRNVYKCFDCTVDQYFDTPLPGSNWERNSTAANPRLLMADEGINIPPPAPPGTDASLDLVPEIEGDDYFLIARVLGASILGFGAQGAMVNPQVARTTTLIYRAGTVLHEVTRPDGVSFALFSMSEIHMTTFNPYVVNGLSAMSTPTGWSYSSQVLTEDFAIGTPTGIANLFAVGPYWAWQEVIEVPVPAVPEPSTGLLVGLGLLGLAGRRRVASDSLRKRGSNSSNDVALSR